MLIFSQTDYFHFETPKKTCCAFPFFVLFCCYIGAETEHFRQRGGCSAEAVTISIYELENEQNMSPLHIADHFILIIVLDFYL